MLSGVDLERSQRTELLNVINEESDRLNRLVGEATEVAQLDAHKIELRVRPYQIREAVDAAIEESKPALSHHSLEVVNSGRTSAGADGLGSHRRGPATVAGQRR